jgi:hypothetical protein
MAVAAALKHTEHRPKAPAISPEAKAWLVHLACSKPKELGYAAEVWSRRSLAKHVREHAAEAGHPSLSQAAKATVRRILAEQPLHPEKVKYYLERRDPEFEAKMRVAERERCQTCPGCCSRCDQRGHSSLVARIRTNRLHISPKSHVRRAVRKEVRGVGSEVSQAASSPQ